MENVTICDLCFVIAQSVPPCSIFYYLRPERKVISIYILLYILC